MSSTKNKIEINTVKKDNLLVKIFPSREEMGEVAAKEVSQRIANLLSEKEDINIVFAAAPSQNDFLHHLIADSNIEWNRINAYHMDEYIGLAEDAPQGFGNFLKNRLFEKVPFKAVHYLNGQCPSPEKECLRYAKLLEDNKIDIVCLGIGENGHLAFNDPPIADFNDPTRVKVVKLDQMCRQQQVNDKCFNELDEVPTHAFTLSIPALLDAEYLFCIVPGSNKANAIYHTLSDNIEEKCPATILRTKENTILYIDNNSSSMLNIN